MQHHQKHTMARQHPNRRRYEDVMVKKFAVTALIFLSAPSAFAQDVKTGAYTAAQATRGQAEFAAHCAACHGPELAGSDMAPALQGPGFVANWSGQTVGDLATRIHTTMPMDNPGSLNGKQVADVVAYILQQNSYPAGKTEIPTGADAQGKIAITAK
jgi:mono/diheme cytochrome c family protein